MHWPWSDRRPERAAAPQADPGAQATALRGTAGAAAPPEPGGESPVWLLDVDGVLNARDPGWDGRRSGWAQAGHGRFHITWAPGLVERVRAIGESGVVEIRWATTWVPWIGQIEQLLGLPHWPAAYGGPYEGDGGPAVPTPWRKLDAAHAVLEDERRALIWTDDDAIPTQGDDLDRLTVGRPSALLIRPSPLHGLQPDHLHAIEAFLRSAGTSID